MVYVLNKNGQPIMPTKNHSKVRLLLKSGKAKVVFVREIKLFMRLKAFVCTIMCSGKGQNALSLAVERLDVWI